MTKAKANRVHIFFNADHMPFMYGAVHIVDGGEENQWWERPFVVSKRRPNGEELVFGTVKRTLERILSQVDRLKKFQLEAQAKLEAEGITPLIPGDSTLPRSEVADRILDDQDELVEDVLLTISVNVRILSEIFPDKLASHEVKVYDYDKANAGKIELSEIANLLVHNRYIVIRGHYVEDLLSDRKFMSDKPQMGLKVNFYEYLSEVQEIINGITVKDLVAKLREATEGISTSSSIKDIVFLTQNLYTLGDSMVGTDVTVKSGPLKTILRRVARQHIDRVYPKNAANQDVQIVTTMAFTTPRFYLEPDLNQKQIRTEVQINGSSENLVMDY